MEKSRSTDTKLQLKLNKCGESECCMSFCQSENSIQDVQPYVDFGESPYNDSPPATTVKQRRQTQVLATIQLQNKIFASCDNRNYETFGLRTVSPKKVKFESKNLKFKKIKSHKANKNYEDKEN